MRLNNLTWSANFVGRQRLKIGQNLKLFHGSLHARSSDLPVYLCFSLQGKVFIIKKNVSTANKRRVSSVFFGNPILLLIGGVEFSIFIEPDRQSARGLIDGFLTLDPKKRISAKDALDSDYFWEEPMPCLPCELPKYEPSHEFQTRERRKVRMIWYK